MKKFLTLLSVLALALVAAFSLVACGDNTPPIDNEPEAPVTGESKSLVVYFSRSGNTQKLANWIADMSDSEIFRVVTEEEYPSDYNSLAEKAKEQLDNGIRPELSTHIEKDIFAEYDTIFLGFPVWWYDLPMPMWSFLEEYDFTGKTIIPYFTHHGSSSGASSISTIKRLCPTATVNDNYLSIYDERIDSAESSAKTWLTELGYYASEN